VGTSDNANEAISVKKFNSKCKPDDAFVVKVNGAKARNCHYSSLLW
jgi:hypothetical protein